MGSVDRLVLEGEYGWRFVLKNIGQIVEVSDYEETVNLPVKRDKVLSADRERIVSSVIYALHSGKWVTNISFLLTVNHLKIRIDNRTRLMLRYLCSLDVKADKLRHKNDRYREKRIEYDSLFEAITEVMAKTLDIFLTM